MTYGQTWIDSSVSSWGDTTGGLYGFKNRIINGAMMIDQRDNGASVTPINGQYSVDRWKNYLAQASKITIQQNAGSVTPPTGFTNYLGITSSSSYSIVSGDYFTVDQDIEGYNISDLGWGTSNASSVTVSFKVYSSLTGTFAGGVYNSATNRSYVFTFSIASANTWTTVSVTIPGDTIGTWLTTNGIGIGLRFNLGAGSTYQTTANTWSAGNYFSTSSAVNVVGTSGATFYITGVQLEKGTTATSFDYRPYGTELFLCQRYYEYGADDGSGQGGNNAINIEGAYSVSTEVSAMVKFNAPKRQNPTVTPSVYYNSNFPASVYVNPGLQAFIARQSTSAGGPGRLLASWTATAEL
jgi:hypothetical protein